MYLMESSSVVTFDRVHDLYNTLHCLYNVTATWLNFQRVLAHTPSEPVVVVY